jgi:hypothetical protein
MKMKEAKYAINFCRVGSFLDEPTRKWLTTAAAARSLCLAAHDFLGLKQKRKKYATNERYLLLFNFTTTLLTAL